MSKYVCKVLLYSFAQFCQILAILGIDLTLRISFHILTGFIFFRVMIILFALNHYIEVSNILVVKLCGKYSSSIKLYLISFN